jgi:hypothetical protein
MKLLVCLLVLVSHISVAFSQGSPLENDYSLVIEGYTLNTKTFSEGTRQKIKSDGVFIDVFDYVLLQGFVEDVDLKCNKKIENRIDICKRNIKKIQKENEEVVVFLKAGIEKLQVQNIDLKEDIVLIKLNHSKTISMYHWGFGISSAVILGLIVVTIVK